MSTYGTVQIGRVTLREDRELTRSVDASSGVVTLSITGQESAPHLTSVQAVQRGQDIMNLYNAFVPVLFTEKPELNGYYTVTDAEADQTKYIDQGVNLIPWQMKLTMVGTDSEVDIESRTGGAQTRANDFSGTGERWHAPAIGALGYYAGASVPAVVTRTGSDGAMPVYRNIAFGIHPRWACPVASYQLGRARFLSGGVERTGIAFAPDPANWEVSNGLVQVTSVAGGSISVNAFTGGVFRLKTWFVQIAGVTITSWDRVSLIRNDYECVQVRLFKGFTGSRCTVDLTLMRGARFIQVYVQNSTSVTIKIVRGTAEAGTDATNHAFVRSSAVDANGNRYVIGSAHTMTEDLVNGGISHTSAVALDAFIGVEIGSAPSGDAALDLFNQYLGIPTELVQGVTR